MKVLLFYQYLNHTSTVTALAEHLKEKGIEIDCLDYLNLDFVSGKLGRKSYLKGIYRFWLLYGRCRELVACHLRKKYFLAQVKDYDVVDIHFYSLFYNQIIPDIKKKKKSLIIMIWGSDFYRASEKELEQKRLGFEAADIIHVESDSVKADFLKKLPEYEHKIFVVQFGLNQLEWIKRANEHPIVPTLIGRDIFENKLIVTCGYNGSKGQQHLRMIEAINHQENSVKQRIHLIIPFTYGGDEEYKKQIITSLNKTDVTYTMLDKRLSDEQLVELRRISQIAVNIQVTDSFSASIQEHFMAGSVQIIGKWLPYDVFYKQGMYAVTISLEELPSCIADVITNYSYYKNKCESNSDLEYKFSSWDYVVPRWESMYRTLNKYKI